MPFSVECFSSLAYLRGDLGVGIRVTDLMVHLFFVSLGGWCMWACAHVSYAPPFCFVSWLWVNRRVMLFLCACFIGFPVSCFPSFCDPFICNPLGTTVRSISSLWNQLFLFTLVQKSHAEMEGSSMLVVLGCLKEFYGILLCVCGDWLCHIATTCSKLSYVQPSIKVPSVYE